MKFFQILIVFLIPYFTGINCLANGKSQPTYQFSKFQAVAFEEIQIKDQFWLPKIKLIQNLTLPLLFDIAEKSGKLDNFRIVSGRKKGKLKLYNAPDSDVYKLIEAAGYSFTTVKNEKLESFCDAIIDDIVAAQDSSGYLHTQYMLPLSHPAAPDASNKNLKTFGFGPENRWKSFKDNWPFAYSQLYCAGHMMEAGYAYYHGTGKRQLFDAAIRFANNICKNLDLETIKKYGDHPQVEIGLMLIYNETGNRKYLQKADDISRYINFSRPVDIHKEENSKPLNEQTCAFGHCVRTAYIYSGATDVIRATGAADLEQAVFSLWNNVTSVKMYVHGGTGNGTQAEQHGENYELPILPTYSECCANIAEGQWNYRLNLLTGEKKYADLVEWLSYNSALSGLSLDGKRFSYSNKLNIDTANRTGKQSGVREEYLFCCPSKLPVFVAGIGRWIYAKTEKGIFVNMFIGSKVSTSCGENKISITQQTNYPYEGKVVFVIDGFESPGFELNIRVPQWLNEKQPIPNSPYWFHETPGKFAILLNGCKTNYSINNGYIHLNRQWAKGDKIEFEMEMKAKRIHTSEIVKANLGRVALSRGPLLYCLEGIDNPFDIKQMVLPLKSSIKAVLDTTVFDGIYVLRGKGKVKNKTVEFKSIPYFMWENRGISPLRTLIIENSKISVEEKVQPTEKMNTNG